jgi:hypothetical protein
MNQTVALFALWADKKRHYEFFATVHAVFVEMSCPPKTLMKIIISIRWVRNSRQNCPLNLNNYNFKNSSMKMRADVR